MILLSQESPELDTEVEKLTALANCHSHRRKDPQDARKSKWIAVFPARGSDVRYVEVQVIELLGSASTKCGAKTESNSCPNRIGGRKVQNFQRTIDEIMRLSIYLKVSHIDYYLRTLEKTVYCSDHELTMPLRKRDYWKSKILEIRTIDDSHNNDLCLNDQQISSQKIPPSSGIPKDSTSFLLEGFDTTLPHIIPRKTRRSTYALNLHINGKMCRNLSAQHRKPGYVYVVQAENMPGHLKIGYTTAPIIERLQSLIFGCNRDMKVLYPTPPESAKMVPNAWRVEELCHAELVDYQALFDCTGCLSEHREWFHISAADAFVVIRKWSTWMKTRPYDPVLGHLKEKEKRKASEMNSFMSELAASAD